MSDYNEVQASQLVQAGLGTSFQMLAINLPAF